MTQRISGKTRVIGLLGSPVSHSKSPRMQNAVFEAMGLDFVYVPFDVGLDRVAAAAEALRALDLRGANVTMPLKRAILPHLDALSPAAELAGAVNVIVNDDGRLTGHITDGEGFLRSLDEAGVPYEGRVMTLLGAGGAATAVAVQAAMEGVREIALFNRRDDFLDGAYHTARLLAERFGCEVAVGHLDEPEQLARQIARTDILVNGTPLGMDAPPDRTALPDPALLHPGLTVCDLIYVPEETLLLRQARAAGCRTVSGLGMQLHQAVGAFRLWTGQEMRLDVARQALYGSAATPPGFLAIWCDMGAEDLADYRAWLTQEHIADRTFSPGFLGVRLFTALDDETSHFILYATAGPQVLHSTSYLKILDTPSPWTRRIMPRFGPFDRAAGAQRLKLGNGFGAFAVAARIAADGPAPGSAVLAPLLELPGVVSLRLMEVDGGTTGIGSAEKTMRSGTEGAFRFLLVLELTSEAETRAAAQAAPALLAQAFPGLARHEVSARRMIYGEAPHEGPWPAAPAPARA